MRTAFRWLLPLALLAAAPFTSAQDTTAIQQKFDAQFPPTKMTADRTDIVTAGSVLVLQKDGLLLYIASNSTPPVNIYKGGKFSQGMGDLMKVNLLHRNDGGSMAVPKKTLVAGQKVWLQQTSVQKDKIQFQVITDAYDDGRYYGVVRLDFPKGTVPSPDDLLKQFAEIFTLPPADTPAPAKAVAAAPAAPMPDIAPPPPPPDADAAPAAPAATTTISMGQTKDQVTAALGAPQKVVKLGSKEIDYYPDMKITFVNGKVSDVQ